MRYEEKVPKGKLVCLEVWEEGGRISKVRITGDFFLHPEERITEIERSLEGLPLDAGEAEVCSRLTEGIGDSQLIGVTAGDLARILKKAVDG